MKKRGSRKIIRFLPLILLISLVTIFFIQSQFKQTGKVIETSQSESTTNTSYIYGNGLVASYDSNGEEKFYINDHLGGTSVVLDENGNKISEESYYAFGEEKSSIGDERLTYTGKEKDDSGLYYYGARYYDADSGRFLQPDPISGNLGNPQSLNKYVYVTNNPMKYVDPSGMEGAVADNTNVVRNPIRDGSTLSNPDGAVNTEDNPVILSGQTVSAAEQEEATRVGMNNFLDNFHAGSAMVIGGALGGLGGVGATGFQAARAYGPGFFWSAVIEGMGVNGFERTQLKFISESTEAICHNSKIGTCQVAAMRNYVLADYYGYNPAIVRVYQTSYVASFRGIFANFFRKLVGKSPRFSRVEYTGSGGHVAVEAILPSTNKAAYLQYGDVETGKQFWTASSTSINELDRRFNSLKEYVAWSMPSFQEGNYAKIMNKLRKINGW